MSVKLRSIVGRTGRVTGYEILVYEKIDPKLVLAPVFTKRFGSALAYEVRSHRGWLYIKIGQGAKVTSEKKALKYAAKVVEYLSSVCGTPHLVPTLIMDDLANKPLIIKVLFRNASREELDLKIEDCNAMLSEASVSLFNASIKLKVAYSK